VLANTGELQRATEILDGLAPEEGPAGFQPAHQMKAINLARQIGKSDDPSLLRRLKRHLDCCNKNASGLHRVWFAYYLAVSDSDNAMQKLVAASEREPQYWLTLADLFAKQGNNSSQARALEAAKKSCTSKIKENPLDIQARLGLAKTLIRQDNIDDAEILLQEGLKLTPNDEMKNVVSHFYLLRYDKATNENESFAKRFAHLEKSIELAAGNSGIYDRLTAMFMTESTKEKRTVIKNELLELIGGNNPTAVVHFALSNLYDLEGEREKSTWHLEQAYQLDNRSVAVANNLAWKLAHQKEPDLDKALELAKQAVEESSANSDYLDTYATVLLLRQEYELAIPQFQKAIGKNREKYLIHKKLAQCYRAIGRPELAKIHEKNSQAPKK
jgi:tetratricopeptide (TPR) repeat protein